MLKSVAFPVNGFLERANNPGRIRDKFIFRQWKSKIDILQDISTLLLRCDQCRMHMLSNRL